MQNLIFYVAAGGPLGTVKDYANAKKITAPTLVLGAACCLRMRLFSDDDHADPFPMSAFASITSWSWQMDTDFDASTTCKIIGDNSDIYTHSVEDTINGATATYTEVVIPISNMLSEELVTLIGSSESVSISGELCGYDQNADLVFIIQIKNFTIRNRISATGDPTELDPEYLTEAQVRALVYGGWDVTFSADAENWHSTQVATDRYIRFRLSGEETAAWSDPVALLPGQDGVTPVISGGSATVLPAGSSPTIDITSSGTTYTFNFGIPAGSDGATPIISGGTVTTLPAGSPASATLVSSGANTYYLNLDLPAGSNGSNGSNGTDGSNGSDGISPTVSVTQLTSGARIITSDASGITSADVLNGSDGHLAAEIQQYDIGSAYAALTFLTYNGGGYQVLSATTAGENPDNAPSKFLCFASKGADGSNGSNGSNGSDGAPGSDGVSPTCNVTQVSSGAIVVTSDASGVSSATILHGRLEGASEVVSALTSGAIVLESEAVPVALRTSAGTLYPLEKGTISISSGSWYIDPAAYLAYDGVSAFSGPWTVYYAGGIPDFQVIHSGGSAIDPQEHQVYQVPLSSGASITVDSSGLASSACMTAELWLDMPTPAVPFTLQSFTWVDGAAPDFASASTRYAITVRWNGTKFLANLAYTEALA